MVANILLNSYAFLGWETEGTAFWVFLVLFLLFFYISMTVTDEKPLTSVFMNLLCAGILYLYSGMSGEVFWFLNIEKVGWLILFTFILTAMLFGLVIGNFWGHLKLVSSIFSDFWVGLVGLVIASVWGYLLIRLGEIVFDEHPILCVITLLGGLSGQAKSSGSGAPEPESGSNPEPTPNPEPSHGFPCCDNCKWNMSRGSFFVRCSQDYSREKEANEKCGQWQRC